MIHYLKVVQIFYRLRRFGVASLLTIPFLVLLYDFIFGLKFNFWWGIGLFLLLTVFNPVSLCRKCPFCGKKLKRSEIMEMKQFLCPHCHNQDLYKIFSTNKSNNFIKISDRNLINIEKRIKNASIQEYSFYCAILTIIFLILYHPRPSLPAWTIALLFSSIFIIKRIR